jgi:hypothetical protein
MRFYGSWYNPEIEVFVIVLHVFYVRWPKSVVCWVRYRFRVFWRAQFRYFEISTIGLAIREILTKIWVLKKCKGGPLSIFLSKKFFSTFRLKMMGIGQKTTYIDVLNDFVPVSVFYTALNVIKPTFFWLNKE